MVADLHIHSIYSDGSLKPEELVEEAEKQGLSTISIADHDTVAGVEEAIKVARETEVEVIPAIEFSTFRGKAEIHILGYFIDYKNPVFLNKIKEIFDARVERAKKMVTLLNEQDVNITYEQVRELAGDDYVGRPHIARAMIEKGYIKEIGDAFTEEYIGNDGKAYIPKYKITPVDAIKMIKEAGGIAVVAHPVFINHGQPLEREDIEDLVDKGLAGIEVFHSKHSAENSDYYGKIAQELGLLITGGSDFHGENSPGVELGDIRLEEKYVTALTEYHHKTLK